MNKPLYVKMKEQDNVAIAVDEIKAGTEVLPGVIARQNIPQAHKMALQDIPQDGAVIRYGVILGYAIHPIQQGDWINEYMLELPTPPDVDHMEFASNLITDLPKPPVTAWEGYPNPWGGPAGTRNILGISTTVQCVTGVLNVAVAKMKAELLPKYPHVDDIVPINHAYGCGVAINESGERKGSIYPELALSHLRYEPFALMHRESTIFDSVSRIFREVGFLPNVLFETARAQTIIEMVASNLCCSIVPDSESIARPENVAFFTLPEHPVWNIVASYKKNSHLNKPARRFVELAMDYWQQRI